MNNFVIYTDSACDIKPEILLEWGVKYSPLSFKFASLDEEYTDSDMPASEFYRRMADGDIAKTSAVNPDTFCDGFLEILENGDDILCISFSSGLSSTYNSARIAADKLRPKFPERRIEVIDSLSASAGLGLLVYLAKERQASGADIDEVKTYIEGLIPRMGIWFTVDDLVYLQRGGRISKTAAFVGNMLGIKPILYMDNEGHLINKEKVRGRRTAVLTLAEKFGELAESKTDGTVFISHGDCRNDAKLLEKTLAEKYGATVKLITDVGPVIGSHSGPGTLAIFFIANQR